jgi:hypothetical protein
LILPIIDSSDVLLPRSLHHAVPQEPRGLLHQPRPPPQRYALPQTATPETRNKLIFYYIAENVPQKLTDADAIEYQRERYGYIHAGTRVSATQLRCGPTQPSSGSCCRLREWCCSAAGRRPSATSSSGLRSPATPQPSSTPPSGGPTRPACWRAATSSTDS